MDSQDSNNLSPGRLLRLWPTGVLVAFFGLALGAVTLRGAGGLVGKAGDIPPLPNVEQTDAEDEAEERLILRLFLDADIAASFDAFEAPASAVTPKPRPTPLPALPAGPKIVPTKRSLAPVMTPVVSKTPLVKPTLTPAASAPRPSPRPTTNTPAFPTATPIILNSPRAAPQVNTPVPTVKSAAAKKKQSKKARPKPTPKPKKKKS